jgi:PAS domain S-box-containing protein
MPHSAQNKNEGSNHFQALFEYATMGILVTNSKGKITAINPFALNEFGYTEKQLIGKRIEMLIPVRFHNKHIHHCEKFSEKPQNRPMGAGMNLFALKKDGTEFPVEVSLGNYHDNDDKYAIAFISNVSVRKKAEAEIEKLNNELEATVKQRTRDLKETLQQLELSRDTLEDVLSFQKAILDNAGAMIIVTDEKGIINLFNPEASLYIGYHEAEVINKNSPVLFHEKTEIARKRKELFNEFGVTIKDDFAVLVEKSRRNIHEEEQYTYVRKNGASFPVSLTITGKLPALWVLLLIFLKEKRSMKICVWHWKKKRS